METIYITSAIKPEQLPPFDAPEIAFVGRSNAGKSSLLNVLAGRRQLAREGKTPGRTQMINFFSLNKKLILADLPGYGYREASKNVSVNWEELIEAYMNRPNLKHIFFLMDVRRSFDRDDLFVLRSFKFNSGAASVLVLTKCDKISKAALKSTMDKLKKELEGIHVLIDDIVPTSTLNRLGMDDLKKRYIEPYIAVNR